MHYMTKTDKADAFYEKHAGVKLTPPVGEQRVRQLGAWGSRMVNVYGDDWSKSARDISIGGLGWVGVGVSGNASFRVWTHEGVQVETREALVPDMAYDLQRRGFVVRATPPRVLKAHVQLCTGYSMLKHSQMRTS